MKPPKRMRQQYSRPFDPVEAYKPPRLKGYDANLWIASLTCQGTAPVSELLGQRLICWKVRQRSVKETRVLLDTIVVMGTTRSQLGYSSPRTAISAVLWRMVRRAKEGAKLDHGWGPVGVATCATTAFTTLSHGLRKSVIS